jgi:hypothetical protein
MGAVNGMEQYTVSDLVLSSNFILTVSQRYFGLSANGDAKTGLVFGVYTMYVNHIPTCEISYSQDLPVVL